MGGVRRRYEAPTTELRVDDEDEGSGELRHELIVVHGPVHGVLPRVVLTGTLVLGREPDTEPSLRLPDAEISRQHARIDVDPASGRARIRDCDSRNGTFVGGESVRDVSLEPGSVIRIGRTLAVYSCGYVTPEEPLRGETDTLLGPSLAMHQLRGWLGLVAPRPLPVLLMGESGAGKECVAREIHRLSGRVGPFVPVNCAAIPAELAESELFGHVAGAFSGARGAAEGLVAAANGGTLLLDEIGELPLPLQPKLLRTLAEGEVRSIGRTEARRVDVRVVAATNRDLRVEVEQERFRHDLYARLTGWTFVVPPLRARREDILTLARAFLAREPRPLELTVAAAEALLLYDWPYNVRELEQAMAAAIARTTERTRIRSRDLPPAVQRPGKPDTDPSTPQLPSQTETPAPRMQAHRRAPDAQELRRVLELMRGNVAHTASHFGRTRQQIYRWAARYGIDLSPLRDEPEA